MTLSHRSLALALLPFLATPALAGQNGPETPLDERRRELLQLVDAHYVSKGENASHPRPNLMLDQHQFSGETGYYEKVLAMFGLMDLGLTPMARVDEANRYLRYAVLGQFRSSGWNHGSRNASMRIYFLYKDRLDPDVLAEFDRRLTNASAAGPYDRDTENIRMTNNCQRLLAHELRGNTASASYAALEQWLRATLTIIGNKGLHEWGSGYSNWTLNAVLNLADFSQNGTVRRLAQMSIDYILALESGFSLNGAFAGVGVRVYPWDTVGAARRQTHRLKVLFTGGPYPEFSWLRTNVAWAVTGYRPLSVVQSLHLRDAPFEARMKTGTEIRGTHYEHHAFRSEEVLISTNQARAYKWASAPHDTLGVFVQTTKRPWSSVVPIGYHPPTTARENRHRTNAAERYFGHENVALYTHGGVVPAGDPDAGLRVPPRLCATSDFAIELQGGWAFLNNGVAYAAWTPTAGQAQVDPDQSGFRFGEQWLRSSQPAGPDGQACVLEVGDAAMFGSYAAFKGDVLARNPDPRVGGGGVLTYTTRSGDVMRYERFQLQVNGVAFDADAWPRADMPGVSGRTVSLGGATVAFDFDGVATSGNAKDDRLATNVTWGQTTPRYPVVGFAHPNGDRISGWAYDHESPRTTIEVVVISSPVHTAPTTIGSFEVTGMAGDEGPIRDFIRNAIGVEPPAGQPFRYSVDFGQRLPQWGLSTPGTYRLRLRCVDQQDPSGNSRTLRDSRTGQNTFSIDLGPGAPVTLRPPSGASGTGVVGQAWGPFTLTATGGAAPYTGWRVVSGTLPDGFALDPATGVLQGTPTRVQTEAFTVRVTDATGQVGSANYTLVVNAAP